MLDTVRALEREDLLLRAWLKRELPLRDYLLGNVFCTTSRWLIFGDTGSAKRWSRCQSLVRWRRRRSSPRREDARRASCTLTAKYPARLSKKG
jgi:hypothetical protein